MDTNAADPSTACLCSSSHKKAAIACPVCGKAGAPVKFITPRHTLKKSVQPQLESEMIYHFCETPECGVAYYNDRNSSVFKVDQLKNSRVTVKDDSPQTPLCYCFKVLKAQALEDIARTGTTNVYQMIKAKMKSGQGCFCEKANPRGECCLEDIKTWLESRGVSVEGKAGEKGKPGGDRCEEPTRSDSNDGGCCA